MGSVFTLKVDGVLVCYDYLFGWVYIVTSEVSYTNLTTHCFQATSVQSITNIVYILVLSGILPLELIASLLLD